MNETQGSSDHELIDKLAGRMTDLEDQQMGWHAVERLLHEVNDLKERLAALEEHVYHRHSSPLSTATRRKNT
jgi:hypothetical protein